MAIPTAGLQLRYKASSITGLGDGAAVSTWGDLSGNARNATQSVTAKKPLYKTGGQNGKSFVRFDNTDDGLDIPQFTFTNEVTCIVITQNNGAAGLTRILVTDALNWLIAAGRSDNLVYFNGGDAAASAAGTTATAHLVLAQTDATGSKAFLDTADITTANSLTTMPGRLGIGGVSYSFNGEPAAADIYEILVYNRILTAAEKTDIKNYAGSEYNLTTFAWTTPPPPPQPPPTVANLYSDAAIIRNEYHALEPDWDAVTDSHIYQDGGKSFNELSDSPLLSWRLVYKDISRIDAAVYRNHFLTYRKSRPFAFIDKEGVTHTDIYYRSISITHREHRSWSNTVVVELVKYPSATNNPFYAAAGSIEVLTNS